MGVLAILVSIGFLYIFATGARKTGAEVFGDRIWWNALRPLHALLFTAFAVAVVLRPTAAYAILLADLIIGVTAFAWYHSRDRHIK
jgi:hypothetical protein